MLLRAWPAVLVLLVLFAGCGRSRQSEIDRMVGTWRVTQLELSGRVLPPQLYKGFDVTITTAHVDLNVGTYKLKAVYVLHPQRTPAAIDLTQVGSKSGQMTQGIYSFEGEKLKLCLAEPGKARPTEFRTTANTGGILLVLERDK